MSVTSRRRVIAGCGVYRPQCSPTQDSTQYDS
ncbi:hypothetical protein ABH920_009459 [Catenulispora sp. EB89]